MLLRVQVEHEVDQRARETRAGADEHRETGAGDLGSSFEIHDAKRGSQIPVRLRGERKLARRPVPSHLCVVRRALSHGHTRVRKIGNNHQAAVAPLLDRVELDT